MSCWKGSVLGAAVGLSFLGAGGSLLVFLAARRCVGAGAAVGTTQLGREDGLDRWGCMMAGAWLGALRRRLLQAERVWCLF